MVAYMSQLILDWLGYVYKDCSYAIAYSKNIILVHLSILKYEVNPEHPKVIFMYIWCVTGCLSNFRLIFFLFAVYSKIYCSNQMQGIRKNDLHDQNTYLRQNQSAWDFFPYLVDWKSNNLFDKNVNVHARPLGIDEIFQAGIIFIGNSYDVKMGMEHLIFTWVGNNRAGMEVTLNYK